MLIAAGQVFALWSSRVLLDVATFAGVLLAVALIDATIEERRRRYGSRNFRVDLTYALLYLGPFPLLAFVVARLVRGVLGHVVPHAQISAVGALGPVAQFGIALVAVDLLDYAVHRAMHRFEVLWAFHRIHHSQQVLTVATAFRFHPAEQLVSALLYATLFYFLALTATSAVIFAVVARVVLWLTHADLDLSFGWIGRLFVSPRFHSLHHSTAPEHRDRNFGSVLSVWDFAFGTAVAASRKATSYGVDGAPIRESFVAQLGAPATALRALLRRKRVMPLEITTPTEAL
jgi:sterol desaturase/sphingolipid hydroxylase (fatty acid hydroxylase superfamily)